MFTFKDCAKLMSRLSVRVQQLPVDWEPGTMFDVNRD